MKNIPSPLSSTQRIDLVFSLYEKYGGEDYIGEPLSQIEHMCQSAQLAEKDGFNEEVILAAFFHDIGHLCVKLGVSESMVGYGIKSHEKIGGDFLRDLGFPERIAKLAENHVQAKRYLTNKYPEYFEKLSEASRKTFVYQGGKMNVTEARTFETDPLFELSLKMRTWDELAKETEIPILDLSKYREMAEKVLGLV